MQDQSSQRYVIVSVDYEIFGNGTGDVRDHIVRPTEEMARICEEKNVPLCIFFEVEEYLGFLRHREALKAHLGYDPASLIREQIISLLRRGHDVQLHLHPQWYKAPFQNGQWQLNWNWAAVDHLFDSQDETTAYIAERKAVIGEMIAEAGVRREVVAYRAGAFCAQPARRLLTALKQNGFAIESSVVRGLHRKSRFGNLDFRSAPTQRGLWRVSTDVCEPDESGTLYEIPIASVLRRRYHQVTFKRLAAKFSRNVPRQRQKEIIEELGISRNPISLARFLWSKFPIKFDYHNVSPSLLHHWIQGLPPKPGNDPLDVTVLIGHTKEHIDNKSFAELLRRVVTDRALKVAGFQDLATALQNRVPVSDVAQPGDFKADMRAFAQ